MKQKLSINYITFQNWKYRRRDIQPDVYLNEVALFERALTKAERGGSFYTVAKIYHRRLMCSDEKKYFRYLKRRGIETSDDYYSHLHVFLTRYRNSNKHREREAVMEAGLKDVLEKTTKALRKDIYDVMKDIGSTDHARVMREFCNRAERKTGGLSFIIRNYNIASIRELYMIVKYVVEHPEEFEDGEVDL